MVSSISSAGVVPEIRMPEGIGKPSAGGDFKSLLSDAIKGVDRLRGDAGKSVERFLAGEGEEVHNVALATQRAELAFELFVQARNKVVSAYQTVMQMQV